MENLLASDSSCFLVDTIKFSDFFLYLRLGRVHLALMVINSRDKFTLELGLRFQQRYTVEYGL